MRRLIGHVRFPSSAPAVALQRFHCGVDGRLVAKASFLGPITQARNHARLGMSDISLRIGESECISLPRSKGLHNYTHPRTDAVVIMIAIDQTGDKILLGHGVRLSRYLFQYEHSPKSHFSC